MKKGLRKMLYWLGMAQKKVKLNSLFFRFRVNYLILLDDVQ